MTRPPRIGHAQVHLDFHTPAEVGRIGDHFDATEFAEVLRDAGADHVNLFAKCHHSWSYYPTRLGRVHPGLSFDLLGQQMAACREAGLVVGVYYTVGWSAGDVAEHPDWAAMHRDGTRQVSNVDLNAAPTDRRPPVSWEFLCPSGEYLDAMVAQVEEIAGRYQPDGFFFDICAGVPCFCSTCRSHMAAVQVDLDDRDQIEDFNRQRWTDAFTALRAAAGIGSDRWCFFNGTTVLHGDADHAAAIDSGLFAFNTRQDLEDLPTTWGGYDKLPLRARYFHTLGHDVTGMSGRFHTTWGEFGGYKSPRALEYEARAMIANGARCNFGDQLHPSGVPDRQTYRIVGSAYRAVAALHDLADRARPDSNLAVCLSGSEDDDQGLARALLEQHREFVVMPASRLDAAKHQAVVLAGPQPTDAFSELARYAEDGGRLLVMGDALAGWPPGLLGDVLGVTDAEPGSADGDYTAFGNGLRELGEGLVYNYEPGWRLATDPGAVAIAYIHDAYFDRTYLRYFSHQNAPPRLEPTPHAGVLEYRDHVIAAHPLGRLYLRHGAEVHRSLVWDLVAMVNPEPTVRVTNLPHGGRVTVMHQPHRSRTLVHVMYAPIVARGDAVIVDDIVPVTGVRARVRLERQVVAVVDPITDRGRTFARNDDGSVTIVFPTFRMHAIAELRH